MAIPTGGQVISEDLGLSSLDPDPRSFFMDSRQRRFGRPRLPAASSEREERHQTTPTAAMQEPSKR
jgi:hypothetical protein